MSSSSSSSSSAVLSSKLTKLLKKTTHHDKDERFMALSDLCSELEQPDCPPLDPPLQLSLSRSLLPLLIDPSVDVQTVAVKTLGLLVKRTSLDPTREVLDKLAALVVDPAQDASRDVYVIGMKTIIAHVAQTQASAELGGRCLLLMIAGLQSPHVSSDIAQAALDLCHALLVHFGSALPAASFEALLGELLGRLSVDDPAVQKRVIATIGALTPMLNERLFNQAMDVMVKGLSAGEGGGARGGGLYVYLQGISAISSSAGSRISRYLPDIVQLLERFCRIPAQDRDVDGEQKEELVTAAEDADVEQQREVRMEVYENVLSAFEALLQRCSHEMTPYVDSIVAVSVALCSYDPNWDGEAAGVDTAGDWADEQPEPMTDDGGEQKQPRGRGVWDDEDDGNVAMDDDNDEDDGSWKVRKAALRCLQALVTSKPDLFAASFFSPVLDALIERINERDSNVQLAVLECISHAVRECVVSGMDTSEPLPTLPSTPTPSSPHIHALLLQANLPIPVHTRPSLAALTGKLSPLFAATLTPHTRLPLPTRRATLDVWKSVVGVMQGGCDDFLPQLIPALIADASHSDVRLRTDALLLLRLTLELHARAKCAVYVGDVARVCVASMGLAYLKAKAEALRLSSTLLTMTEDRAVLQRLYDAVKCQLLLTDVDAEVKEAALSAMALLLSLHHSRLPTDAVSAMMPVFHSRLGNEVTRLSALRAITRLTTSPSLPLTPILSATISDLLVFLRKDNAVLRQETMLTLLALVRTQAGRAESLKGGWGAVVREVEGYIDDRDVYLSTLVMDSIRGLLRHYSDWLESDNALMPRLMGLLQSPMLQGGVLASLTALFTALAAAGTAAEFSYESLVDRLSNVNDKMSSATLMATAQCISAITANASPAQREKTITASLAALNVTPAASAPASSSYPTQQLALYVLGGIGHHHDLSTVHRDTFSLVAASLAHPSDVVKQASAWSLGSVTTGNIDLFLPQLLRAIEADPAQHYLTLSSLLTVIQTAATSPSLLPHIDTITALLFRYSEGGEEGERALVSECLGGLTLVDPERLVPQLVERVTHREARVREVVVTALRYAVPAASSSPGSLSSLTLARSASSEETAAAHSASALQLMNLLTALASALPSFFPLLADPILPVQRQALLTMTSLTHSQPSLVQPLLPDLLPLLYPPLTPVPAHIRVVDLGPFKHRVDDGLPLRQAALTALSTVFSSLHPREDHVREWIRRGVRAGLAGEVGDGVAVVVWEEVERLALRYEKLMVSEVDGLVPDMMKSIREQLKAAKEGSGDQTGGGGGQGAGGGGGGGGGGSEGAGRARDVLRICVRALLALQRMRGVEARAVFQEFYARVLKTQLLVQLMNDMNDGRRQ